MDTPKTEHGDIKKYIPVYVATGICQISVFIYLGMLPFLFTEFGADMLTFGYVMSAASFLTLCSSPLLGRVADSIGSRTVLIFCMLSASAAHLTMGIAWSIPMLVVSRVCGVIMDCMPVAQMAVTDMSPAADRSYYLGKLMIPMSVALILGPPTSGFLTSYIGSQRTALLSSLLPVIAIVLILLYVPSTKKAKAELKSEKKSGIDWGRLRALVTKGDIPHLLSLRFLTAFPAMLFLANFQLAGVKVFNLDAQGIGMLGAALGAIHLLNGIFILSFITSRLRPENILRLGIMINFLTFIGLTFTTEVWQLFIVLCLVVVSFSTLDNQITATLSKAVDPNDSSTMLGISTAILHLCRTLSPTVGGALMQTFGFYTIGGAASAVSLLAVLLAFLKTDTKTKTS